jgi:hypothetical protein
MIKNKKIYEIVWLSDELDLLDLRFHELYDYIDKWIIVEYPMDYARNQRPLYYNENKERFKEFEDKIIHVIDNNNYDNRASLGLLWERKKSPLVKNALLDLKPDDYLITNDGDCLLTKHIFENFDPAKLYSFCVGWFLWYYNCRTPDAVFNWGQAAPFKYYDDNMMVKQKDIPPVEYIGDVQLGGKEAGYHFCKCGTPESISVHLRGHPHQDLVRDPSITDIEKIKERMENGYGWTDVSMGKAGKDWRWPILPIDISIYPEYLQQNPQIFRKYFSYKNGIKNTMGLKEWEKE